MPSTFYAVPCSCLNWASPTSFRRACIMATSRRTMKALYYGDNLQVLRDSIATESVDLIYLDPPFNSKAS